MCRGNFSASLENLLSEENESPLPKTLSKALSSFAVKALDIAADVSMLDEDGLGHTFELSQEFHRFQPSQEF